MFKKQESSARIWESVRLLWHSLFELPELGSSELESVSVVWGGIRGRLVFSEAVVIITLSGMRGTEMWLVTT